LASEEGFSVTAGCFQLEATVQPQNVKMLSRSAPHTAVLPSMTFANI